MLCIYSIISSVFSLTQSFRIHSNVLICCPRIFSIGKKCMLLNIFVETFLCANIINVFTVAFDQFNAFLLNKSIKLI